MISFCLPSDIDGDGIISRMDICDMLDMITDRQMSDDKKNQIIDGVYNII